MIHCKRYGPNQKYLVILENMTLEHAENVSIILYVEDAEHTQDYTRRMRCVQRILWNLYYKL